MCVTGAVVHGVRVDGDVGVAVGVVGVEVVAVVGGYGVDVVDGVVQRHNKYRQ